MIGSPSLTLLRISLLQRIGRLRSNNSLACLDQDGQDLENVSMSLSSQNVSQKFTESSSPLLCRICGKPVAVETCKTDDGGNAIHEDCYALKLKLEAASKDGRGS